MTTLILHTENENQTNSIVKLAKSLKVKVEVKEENEKDDFLLKVAELSFAKEWTSEADEHWDEFLKNAIDVSKR
jgi:hypothetical protein